MFIQEQTKNVLKHSCKSASDNSQEHKMAIDLCIETFSPNVGVTTFILALLVWLCEVRWN